jgi:hypothetical protein
VAFVMLSVAIVFTAPPLPTLNSTGADIVTYYTDHQYGFLVGNYLGAVAVLPAIIVIVYLTVLVRDGTWPRVDLARYRDLDGKRLRRGIRSVRGLAGGSGGHSTRDAADGKGPL